MVLINNKIKGKSTVVLPEILLNNRLEKDIQRMIYPVNLMLSLFLSSKYTIKDDYITPKGKIFYILTFFCVLIVYGLVIYHLFWGELEDTMSTYNSNMVTIWFAFFFITYCVGFSVHFVLNIVHRDMSISLILLIQTIYKSLDFSESLKRVTCLNWISILSAVSINVFFLTLYYGIYEDFFVGDIILDFMFTTIDINIVYAILVIMLLRKYLEKWIKNVLMANGGQEHGLTDFFGVYRNILEAYNLYKSLFQLLILFHTVDTFFRSLCYFSIILQIMTRSAEYNDKEVIQYSVTIFLAALWLIKDMSLVIIQSVLCEKFYLTVEEAETACIQRLKYKNYLDCEENLCNNVIQVNRASFRKMSACGLFYIDASLPILLMGLLTNYIVVLLQSTFL